MWQEEFSVIGDGVSRANFHRYNHTSMAARSKARACSRLFAGIAASNPAEGMDVCFL
jgi:hypothetical protein